MWSRTKSYGRLTGYINQIMSRLLVHQVPVIQFLLETSQVRQSHPTYGVTAFHVSFLSLDLSQNDSRLTVFLTKSKRVFHVSILSSVRLGNGYASGRISCGQDSANRPRHTYYITVLVFVFLKVCTTLVHSCRMVQCFLIATVCTGVTSNVYIGVSTVLAHLCSIF